MRIHDQQPGGITRIGWSERNPLVRQVEIEKVYAHVSPKENRPGA